MTASRFKLMGYLAVLQYFFLYWEKELRLRILEAEIVFSRAGVAMVSALLRSRLVLFLFLLVEQLVF